MDHQKNLLENYKNFLYLVFTNVVKSAILIYLPRFVIEIFNEKTYANYIIFQNYFAIISILSLDSLNRILLKSESYDKFLMKYKNFFYINCILYFFFTILIFYKVKNLILILLLFNSIFLIYNFVQLTFIFKKKIFNIILIEILYLFLLFLILFAIKNLNYENEYALIMAYSFTVFIIIIVNYKIIKPLININNFNVKNFFVTAKIILRENLLYYDLLKISYFPLLLFIILTFYSDSVNFEQIITSIGILMTICLFPGNLISKTFGLLQINSNINNKNFFFFSIILSLGGIFFFLAIYLFFFEFISNFYLQNNNAIFKFVFNIFILFGFFHYISEIYASYAIKSNYTKVLSNYFFFTILSLLIIFLITKFFYLTFEWLIIIAVLTYAISQCIIIFRLNILWLRYLS
jgi:hypothetical protein